MAKARPPDDKAAAGEDIPAGSVRDFVSGEVVRATPEELEAVRPFSKRLVEEYAYPRAVIQTRPQFRVPKQPSGAQSWPVDIAVFRSDRKLRDEVYIVVECKRRKRKDGETQLKMYLGNSAAELGVWFNGAEHLYLQKQVIEGGRIVYRELPNIPRHGERLEDVGKFRRDQLVAPPDLRATFRDVRNHLAGMTTGITRDEDLARQLINILFCKIFDELETPLNQVASFRAGVGENPTAVRDRIIQLFEGVKQRYGDVFAAQDTISLDANSLYYVVGELQGYAVMEAPRDAIADAFEVFIGPRLRGEEGQFFTPRNVVRMMVEILDPRPGELVIDPACGSGGFLIASLERVWHALDQQAVERGWTPQVLEREKGRVATDHFRGIDKDAFLARVTKAYMAIVGDGRGGVLCENSLRAPTSWDHTARDKISFGSFDVVVTNPPFGSKIRVEGEDILGQYDLAKTWKKTQGEWMATDTLRESQAPQVLFIERCLQLLKPGGRLGIVLPESIFGNPSHGYIVNWLLEHATLEGIVSMPEDLFQPYTHAKTCVVFLRRNGQQTPYHTFMAAVKWCGHESRGRQIHLDEVPSVAERYADLKNNPTLPFSRLGFLWSTSDVVNNIFIPKYYDPDIERDLTALAESHELITISELIARGILSLSTGDEVGKLAYGTGEIPFIRTSDLANWELKLDPKQGVSVELWESLRDKQDVRPEDLLFVRDGTYLIGTTAMVTALDLPLLYQSHLYRIRVDKTDELSPFVLLAVLNNPLVRRQIRAKQFTQDIIDTLGQRIRELVLPLPKSMEERERIAGETREIVEQRARLRYQAHDVAISIAKPRSPEDEALADVL